MTSQQEQNPHWYAALSIEERVASLRVCQDGQSLNTINTTDTPRDIARATQRLNAWKRQKPFNQTPLFIERLAADSLTEEMLAHLLAEPVAALRDRYVQTFPTPGWLVTLGKAFAEYADDDETLLFEEQATERVLAAYLQPILPLMRHGMHRLRAGIQEICQQYSTVPFDQQQIAQALWRQLPEQLLAQLSKTFVLEMHVARVQNLLQGETPQARFADFVRQLSQEDRILKLFEEYPLLARQLILTIDHWVDYALEFLSHLCADWADICSMLTPGHDPGPLVEVQGGAGDVHRRGRSVLVLTFRSGFKLLYKPKSLAVDKHLQELLTWLNAHGADPAFRTITIIERGSYGWSEFVHAAPCTSVEEVARFYARQGSYLALLYALNATDMHVENIIAAAEHPILIDLEALFHPHVGGDDPTQPSYLATLSLDQSVFRVGLLPCRIWSNKDALGVDLSGLGGQQGQLTPGTLPHWEAVGTDQMQLGRQRVEIPAYKNRPTLNGGDVDVLDYRSQLTTGFTHMYRLLQAHRDEIITTLLPLFAHDEIRLLLRPTRRYANLLMESFHPDLLRDGLERERFFDAIWREVELRPYLARVIAAEKHDLLQGDIPMFTTRPASRTIVTANGQSLPNFFDETSLELVTQRLLHLNEQDHDRQVWIIEAALATLLIGPEQIRGKAFLMKPAQSLVTRERLLASACAVGERLAVLATRNAYGVSWLGVSVVSEDAWSLLPTDLDLYSGTSGIALFLAYLGALTGEPRYSSLARLSLTSMRAQVEQLKNTPKAMGIGAFNSLGSAIYLLMHLSTLWHEPALLQEAEALVEILPELISQDDQLDVIGGAAGCIINLMSLYSLHPTPRTLAVALQCGEHLLSHAQAMQTGLAWTTIKHTQPLGGLAHGSAGIALSLLQLAFASGQQHFHAAALAALAYDRSLFSPAQQNWADLRTLPPSFARTTHDHQEVSTSQEGRSPMVAWCHGASGIGLSRLGMLPYLDNATIREEIDIALKTTIAWGFSENHSLCHGSLGNLDLLLTATQTLNTTAEALERITAMVMESIDECGWVTGVPLGIETPGLMTGITGIGYELLRLAEPQKVPSVLLLAPPAPPFTTRHEDYAPAIK